MVNDKYKDKFRFIDAELDQRIERRQMRQLRNVLPLNGIEIKINGQTILNFCSNDYLGLSMHPLLQERSIEFINKYGSGATASRLICGNFDFYEPVENKLAQLKQVEAALVLSSGFQANISVISALADRNSLILSDQFNHNSLIQGCRLARCKVAVYRHNDLSHLAQLLVQNSDKGFSRIFIVTESVFSMDGDMVDMGVLVALAEKYNAFLIVDDAHATGVFGHQGMGLTCGHDIDLVIGTFGKAGGSYGAYLACSKKIRSYMINCCSGLIYTTALPPSVLGAIDAALDLIPAMDGQRQTLLANAKYLRGSLHEMGWQTGHSSTQIIPIMIGKEADALGLSNWLEENGILVSAIRPPTVPVGASRMRLSLSALHTRKQIDRVIDVLQNWRLHK
jgi:8-amino-7-oxononanoate synthase